MVVSKREILFVGGTAKELATHARALLAAGEVSQALTMAAFGHSHDDGMAALVQQSIATAASLWQAQKNKQNQHPLELRQ